MRTLLPLAALLAISCSRTDNAAQTTPAASPPAEIQTLADAADSTVEPVALEALERMSTYLRTVNNFEVRAVTTTEEVLDDGQKVQLSGVTTYRVRRPNAFFIEKASDRRVRQFYYDGAKLSVVAPRMNYYTTLDAPPTIKETIEQAEDRYDISVPLTDLFYWGTPDARTADLRSGSWVGFAKVDGADCDQYAFRQDDLDWQIWIQRGERPVPRKIVITSHTDPALPQYVAQMSWNVAPRFGAQAFRYQPAPQAHEISIAQRNI